jgi:hypothetical protein
VNKVKIKKKKKRMKERQLEILDLKVGLSSAETGGREGGGDLLRENPEF